MTSSMSLTSPHKNPMTETNTYKPKFYGETIKHKIVNISTLNKTKTKIFVSV